MKEKLINSGILNSVGSEFTKYDIDDFRRQTNNQSLSDKDVVSELILEEVLSEYNSGSFKRLNSFLFQNRKLLERSAVASFFVYAEIVPLLETKICEYENIIVHDTESHNESNIASQSSICPFVIYENIAEEIIDKIKAYQKGKSTPKDVAQPIRAAIEAGVIRRPSFSEYSSVAGLASIHKSSFSEYTNPEKAPYLGESNNEMINDFRNLLQKNKSNMQ